MPRRGSGCAVDQVDAKLGVGAADALAAARLSDGDVEHATNAPSIAHAMRGWDARSQTITDPRAPRVPEDRVPSS